MSDTPRTDKEAFEAKSHQLRGAFIEWTKASFARTLERELTEAIKQRDEWRAMAMCLAEFIEAFEPDLFDSEFDLFVRFRKLKRESK